MYILENLNVQLQCTHTVFLFGRGREMKGFSYVHLELPLN